MDYKITGVNNFSGRCHLNIRINLQNLIHRFTHYLDITFNATAKKGITAKIFIFPRTIFEKRLNLKDRAIYIREVFTQFPIHR